MQLSVEYICREKDVNLVYLELLDTDFNKIVYNAYTSTHEHNYIETIFKVFACEIEIYVPQHAVAKRLSDDKQLQNLLKNNFQRQLVLYRGV
jgi:hypothetical protein